MSALKPVSRSRVLLGRDATISTPAAGRLLRRVPLLGQMLVLLVLIGVSAVVAIGLGPVGIPPARVAAILADHLTGRPVDGPDAFIVWQLRVPRVIESLVVGAGLAMSGAVVQALVRNPVADAYVLGLSSGAGVGAVLVLTIFGATAAGSLSLPTAAFAGALLSGIAVFAVARTQGRLQAGRLVMVGIAVGHLLSGVTSFLVLRSNTGDAAQQVMFWLLGSLSGAQLPLARMSASIVAVLTVLLWLRAGRLNLLALGDDTAAALGMHPTRARTGFFVLTALLVGTVVAVSGAIGFVGLVVPNLARLLVGADHRRVVPLCAALGALLLLWADTGARLLLSPTEVPIGILTAVVGVPFFVLAVRRSSNGQVAL